MSINDKLLKSAAAAGGLTPSENFKVVTYTGNSSTQAITGVGFKPDFVWTKVRAGSTSWHFLADSTRGGTEVISSNSNNAEQTRSNHIQSFDSDGFTLGADGTSNYNGETYVAWCWKANGGTTSSNGEGSITSTVQANTDAGFSIVKYTGNGTAGATVGHGLGAVPSVLIVKMRTDAGNNWRVYHKYTDASSPEDYNLVLNSTAARYDRTEWNDTAPTSSVFSVSDHSSVNTNTKEYICYAFTDIEGFSKFGSYTGNGSTNGPVVETGFEVGYLMIKCTSDSGTNWRIYDNKRNTTNPRNCYLNADANDAEECQYAQVDFLSNGFQLIGTDTSINGNGRTQIYMAFATDPDTEAPELASSFNMEKYVGTKPNSQNITGYGFDPNFVWLKDLDAADNHSVLDTVRGQNLLQPNDDSAETAFTAFDFITDGFSVANSGQANESGDDFISFGWKANDDEPTALYDSSAIAAYKFEDDVNDVGGNYNGTATSITYVTGKFNKAVNGAASNSRVTLNYTPNGGTVSGSAFTWSFWVKSGSTSGIDTVIGAGTQFIIALEANKLYPMINGSNRGAGTSITADTWHHFAITYSSGTTQVYKDGSLDVTVTGQTPTSTYSSIKLFDSDEAAWGVLEGSIDQVRIYDKVLSSSNITDLYNETASDNSTLAFPDNLPQGELSSVVSVNANAGFSIVKYTGTGSAMTVQHGLSSAPTFIIVKALVATANSNWAVYHTSIGNTKALILSTNAAEDANAGYWNNTSPTATVFTVGTYSVVNESDDPYIAYCFHDVAGYSKFGGYTSNASTKITTGFKPDFFIFKYRTAGDWYIQNSLQTEGAVGSNGGDLIKKYLVPNTNAAEASVATGGVEIVSDGFYPTNWFDTTNGFIYAAFKKNVASNTTLANSFKAIAYTGNQSTNSITGVGFRPDLVWLKERSGSDRHVLIDSIRGEDSQLSSDSSAAVTTYASNFDSFDTDGFTLGDATETNGNSETYIAWCWKAGNTWQSNIDGGIPSTVNVNTANGFSIVKYTGTSSAATVGHGLSATPEIIIVKKLDATQDWWVYHKDLNGGTNPAHYFIRLNLTDAESLNASSGGSIWNSTAPTSTVFSTGTTLQESSDYIAYCWAPKSGFSKFGSYSGSGSDGNAVSLGFQPDFVMIKRTNSTGGWLMFDSARNTSNPRNNRLEADNGSAEQTGSATKFLDFNSTDFEANGSDSEVNASGSTYVYMAFKIN